MNKPKTRIIPSEQDKNKQYTRHNKPNNDWDTQDKNTYIITQNTQGIQYTQDTSQCGGHPPLTKHVQKNKVHKVTLHYRDTQDYDGHPSLT